jgi:RNA polymerase sigma-70 factor (ECF subfamily)
MNAHELPLAISAGLARPGPGSDVVADSSRDLLAGIWEHTRPELARVAAAMGVRADRIDDLLHEVFITAWQKPPDQVDARRLKWWLIRVTTNRSNLEHRRRKCWRVIQEHVGRLRAALANISHTGQAAIASEERELVRRALARLPPEQRTVLVLKYFEDYDARQIGQILDMPHSTVRSHLHRGRQALAMALKQAGYEHDSL